MTSQYMGVIKQIPCTIRTVQKVIALNTRAGQIASKSLQSSHGSLQNPVQHQEVQQIS
jgi:hypothetical protein